MERGAALLDPPDTDPHAALTQAVADMTALLAHQRRMHDLLQEVCAMEGRRARLLRELAREQHAVWPAARAALTALHALLQATRKHGGLCRAVPLCGMGKASRVSSMRTRARETAC